MPNPIEIARKCRDFASDGVLDLIVDAMKKDCVDQWMAATDTEAREYQHLRLSVVEDFARQFRIQLENGQFAERRIKD